MYSLSELYRNDENYEDMKKYYQMAIEKANSDAMTHLGHYYQYTEINYKEMMKYYLMAIEKENSYAMTILGNYYEDTEINYKK